jgi:hypothetical protein
LRGQTDPLADEVERNGMNKIKIDPFTLTMPDNGSWRMGPKVGEVWSAGKKVKG